MDIAANLSEAKPWIAEDLGRAGLARLKLVSAVDEIRNERAAYGNGSGQRRWLILAGVLVAHVMLLTALILFDVVPMPGLKQEALVVTLIQPNMAPPPPPPAEPETPLLPDPPPAIVAPPPLIQAPAAPQLIRVVDAPPPPKAAVVAPPEAKPGPPAPITPPDYTAGYLDNPAPRYPVESRRKGEEGAVVVQVSVSIAGQAQEIRVVKSSGYSRLDDAAVDAIRRWRFAPALQAGQPVAAWVEVRIPFVLEKHRGRSGGHHGRGGRGRHGDREAERNG